jgi:hypothetical protein
MTYDAFAGCGSGTLWANTLLRPRYLVQALHTRRQTLLQENIRRETV